MITLAHITLPAGLLWSDEFAWQPVAQSAERALDGSLLLFSRALSGGRPITLESGAWVSYAKVQALQALASTPDGPLLLTFRDVNYSVHFNHAQGPALSAVPVFPLAAPAAGDLYAVSIKLITI